jgi:hypothetical protein
MSGFSFAAHIPAKGAPAASRSTTPPSPPHLHLTIMAGPRAGHLPPPVPQPFAPAGAALLHPLHVARHPVGVPRPALREPRLLAHRSTLAETEKHPAGIGPVQSHRLTLHGILSEHEILSGIPPDLPGRPGAGPRLTPPGFRFRRRPHRSAFHKVLAEICIAPPGRPNSLTGTPASPTAPQPPNLPQGLCRDWRIAPLAWGQGPGCHRLRTALPPSRPHDAP